MNEMTFPEQPAILFAEECDRGLQNEENQDSVLHVRIALGELLIVADGIGGGIEGAMASRLVVEHFYAHMAALPHDYPADKAIREAAALANEKILEAAKARDSPKESKVQMGSTVVVALIQMGSDGINAWIGNIGTSRAYLVRAERLYRLTTDHSAAQSMVDRGLISPEEAQHHPAASTSIRRLGSQPEVEIDIEQNPLAIGDTLLLCSYGLWSPVPEKEIEAAAAGEALGEVAHKLLEQALAVDGRHNIAIEMVRLVVPLPPAAPRKSELPRAFKWIVTIFLLAIAGLCVLLYTVFWRH
jgi:serine/threonine protein phosphatase PrpC